MAAKPTNQHEPSPSERRPGVGQFLARYASLVLTALAVATALLAWPMIAMQPTNLASQTPVTRVTEAQELIDSRFAPVEHDILLVIEARNGNILDPATLTELHMAVEAARARPEIAQYLVAVDAPELGLSRPGTISITDAVDNALEQSGLAGGLFAAPDNTIAQVVSSILDETGPGRWGLAKQATSNGGRWTSPAIFVNFATDNAALGGGGRVVTVGTNDTRREQFARDLLDTIGEGSETFDIWTVAADVNLTAEDQGLAAGPFIAATVAAVLVVLGLAFRSYWPVASAGLALGALMVWIKGGSNLFGFKEDQILSTILPIAMVSFGIDSTFHGLGRIRESGGVGSSRRTFAIGFTAVAGALLLAASTDVAAFLANTTSSIESLRQFGFAAALSTVAAFILLGVAAPLLVTLLEEHTGRATLTGRQRRDLLPALAAAVGATTVVMVTVFLSQAIGAGLLLAYGLIAVVYPAVRLTHKESAEIGEVHHHARSTRLGIWVRAVAERPKITLGVVAVVTAIAGWAALGLNTNFEVSEFFDPASDFLVGIDKAQAYIGTQAGEPIIVLVEGPLSDRAVIENLTGFVDAVDRADDGTLARNADGTVKASTGLLDIVDLAGSTALSSFLEDALRNGVGELDASDVSQFLRHDPDSDLLSTIITFEIPDTRQQASVHAVRKDIDPLVADLETTLRALDPEAQAVLAGSPIVRDDQLAAIAGSLMSTLPVAALACLILAAVFMRSLRYGIVTIVPIGLVVVWLFGFMAATGRSINAVTAIVGAVSIGIGIDYATHLTIRFLEEHHRSGDALEALEVAGAGTGGALAGSAGTSVAGFAILALAPMPLFSSYGVLTVVMIIMALVASLFVLPALLVLTTSDQHITGAGQNSIEAAPIPPRAADARARSGGRPTIELTIGADGTWVEAMAHVDGETHRRRGAANQDGIIEAMLAAVTASDADPPPFPVSVSRTSTGAFELFVLVLEHPGGTLTAGTAPIGGPMTAVLETAVLSALGWPTPRP